MNTIELKNIVKTYPSKKTKLTAVDDVSFSVNEGELFGLIGPDGAGKSSIFRILTTLLLSDSGSASVMELDVVNDYKEIRKIVGYMPGRFSLYQDLTVEENLEFFATIFNTTIEANYNLIADIYIQLEPFKKRRAGKLSGGMKQKLALCCALIHKPKVLFLDEPTTGVDPVSRKEFWEMLKRLKEQYDYIFIDCPPSLGLLTLNALTASESVLIPVQCEYFALEGLGQLLNTINLVRKNLNPNLAIEGVLLTMFDRRLKLSHQVKEEVIKYFGEKVFNSVIYRNVRISEAPSHQKPVLLYDAISTGAANYMALANELIERKKQSVNE